MQDEVITDGIMKVSGRSNPVIRAWDNCDSMSVATYVVSSVVATESSSFSTEHSRFWQVQDQASVVCTSVPCGPPMILLDCVLVMGQKQCDPFLSIAVMMYIAT